MRSNGLARVRRAAVAVCLALAFAPAHAEADDPPGLDLTDDYRRQYEQLVVDMADRDWCRRVAEQVAHRASLIEDSDRDPADVVIRRTAALLDHLRGLAPAAFADRATDLESLRRAAGETPVTDGPARYALYERACRLRRRIALANPLLDFDSILFLGKHRPMRGDHHMVDQYYAFNARPGGGVFVLEDAFGDRPCVRDLLENTKVEQGRLAGRTLDGGAFNTLDLDFDGRTVVFAWSECGTVPADASWRDQPWPKEEAIARRRAYYYWSPQTTFHIFRATVDGTALTQLTDGPQNDIDPCFLPSGRIVFVSERRGGFLRCGDNRPNPVYTLHGMMADGSDIIPLSAHETQEWNPSVNEQGMIAYTRWDYVDRDTDGGHHLWTCHPDGRDPRSPHGNYPRKREIRPWMEVGIRAVPGSNRYVAVAAPHHGYAYGSLVLIDPSIEDDGGMSQVRRITPEAHFPESESAPGLPHPVGKHRPRGELYGTPWPLDEAFHLCVYDSEQQRYGLYLVDHFGIKELLWRDPSIASLDPIPLRPRRRPPVIPIATTQARADQDVGHQRPAVVSVLNAYEAASRWPDETKIASLRIVQLFPKATYAMNRPMVGKAPQSLARGVVGTVPVEADGSAHFEAPVGVPIYFQALDERGLAIQSMRSATYLHTGEHLSCVGCHENRHAAPATPTSLPIAMRRPPSKPTPEVPNTFPIVFPQLVQPVLDRHCVTCHREQATQGAPDLTGEPADHHAWSRSFVSLLPFAWGHDGGNGIIAVNGMRSTPGAIGARASRLLALLENGHHGVNLSDEDLRRITVWLDCNSNFFGDYVELEKQRDGGVVTPALR